MNRTGKLAVGVAFVTVLAGAAAYHLLARDPFREPGQSWNNKTPHNSEVLRLLNSGRYVARVWCDVCPVQIVFGTWSKAQNVVTLQPDHEGDIKRVLIETESNGCRLLAHPKAVHEGGLVNPLMAYLRDGEPCEFRPGGYTRKP